MKSSLKYILLLLALLLIGGVVYFKVFIPKHTFRVVHPTKGSLQEVVRGIGNVNGLNIYTITAQSGGKILQILTDEGKMVRKGDLLVVMDGVDLPQQLIVARANLKKAEYEKKALQEELANQEAQRKLLQLTFNRYKKLNKNGFVAKAEYDKAQADLQAMLAAIRATGARIDSAVAAVQAARGNVAQLQQKIDRLRVYAPTDGLVIAREAEVAQYVLPATPVLKIIDPNTLWVETKVDERLSALVKVGRQASIVLRSQPDTRYKGVVRRIDAMSDAVTLERTINVAFTKIPVPFFINEQARVTIVVRQLDQVLKIPRTVLVQRGGKDGVWVDRNGRAHFLPITTIGENNSEVALADDQKGLAVIVPDSHKKSLREGMRIFQ